MILAPVLPRLALGSIAIVAIAVGVPGDDASRSLDVQVAAKQHRLRTVVAELAARDVANAPEERRVARERALALLSDYAERAEFTLHHEAWPRELPLFIDEHGTRCALAAVLDGIGEDEVVTRLARDANDAYLAEIADDPEIARCLDELGLTIDEAAYIQGPGARDRSPNDIVSPPAQPSEEDIASAEAREAADAKNAADEQRRNDQIRSSSRLGTEKPATGPKTGSGPKGPTTGGTRPAAGGGSVARRGADSGATFTWSGWWGANRDQFVQLRARYHDGVPVTSDPESPRGERPLRPEPVELRDELMPFFATVAASDRDLRATALAMWARSADESAKQQVLDAVLEFLADPHQADREWGPVMLAMLATPAARAPLAELVRDSHEGRRLYGRSSAVPEAARAFAAIAYARSDGTIDVLKETLADAPAAHQDVAAACVVAIGLAGRDLSQRAPAIAYLVSQLEKPTLPESALAQVPSALVLTGDRAALPAIHAVVAHFRGPRELRRSCALALGRLADDVDETIVDALIALARRDVDADGRHAAITALGLLAARQGAHADDPALAKLHAFHVDALAGRFRQDADMPWHALSAGLFARGQVAAGDEVRARLRWLAGEAADAELRATACLALGLAQDENSAPILTAALEDGSEVVASCAAQALGLAGVQAARGTLLDLCTGSPNETIGYSAAFALGCLADPSMVEPMLATFEDTPSASVRTALTRALGELGDRRAVPGLRRFALDEKRDAPSRERALAALGVLAQADDVAWNAPIKQALSPGAATPSLQVLLELF